MASAVDSRLAYARLSAVATASRLPTANRGSNNSYTTSWDTTSPRQRCMSSWRLRASCTRSAFPPTGCCNRASLIYSDDRLADLRKK